MPTGADIPQEAFERAVETLRRVLGFEDPRSPRGSMPASVSVNTALPQPKPMVPMDTESYTRYETIAGATKWKP